MGKGEEMKVEIIRQYLPDGTFGYLFVDGIFQCYTIERDWRNNRKGVSCIPEGDYKISTRTSPKFGWCLGVSGDDVGFSDEHRTHILFHSANHPSELNGCIAPVYELGTISGTYGGKSSKAATNALFKLLSHEEHNLKIRAGNPCD